MYEEIKEQIKVVVEARQNVGATAKAVSEARILWEEENKVIIQDSLNASIACMEAEAKLRELTLNAFNQTGDKTLIPGVKIRMLTKFEYDPRMAFKWAIEHSMALSLDTRAFEKIAKASPPDFVTVNQVPQATIATELKEV
jgi:hypothetical protein